MTKIIMVLMLLNTDGHVTVGHGGEFDSEESCQAAAKAIFADLPPEFDAGRLIAGCIAGTYTPKPSTNS